MLEWRTGVRRTEAIETDPHRIAQRQKQIDYGKNTLGYQRYTEEVPKCVPTLDAWFMAVPCLKAAPTVVVARSHLAQECFTR